MDEIRRYMRYVLPGLTSLGFVSFMFFLSDPEKMKCIFKTLASNSDFLGLILGIFLSSGAIGFLFSIAYNFFYWTLFPVNHKILFEQLSTKIEIVNPNTLTKVPIDKLNKRRTWEIFTQYSYNHISNSNTEFQKFIDRLIDILHSLGSLFIGVLLGLTVWIGIHYCLFNQDFKCNDLLIILCFLSLLCIIGYNFYLTAKTRQRVSNDTIAEQIINNPEKITIHAIQ